MDLFICLPYFPGVESFQSYFATSSSWTDPFLSIFAFTRSIFSLSDWPWECHLPRHHKEKKVNKFSRHEIYVIQEAQRDLHSSHTFLVSSNEMIIWARTRHKPLDLNVNSSLSRSNSMRIPSMGKEWKSIRELSVLLDNDQAIGSFRGAWRPEFV